MDAKWRSDKRVNQETNHTGLVVEQEGCQLIQRLGVTHMKAATPTKLVEWIALGVQDRLLSPSFFPSFPPSADLTKETIRKEQYFPHFALTFRSFMSCHDLMNQLSHLFDILQTLNDFLLLLFLSSWLESSSYSSFSSYSTRFESMVSQEEEKGSKMSQEVEKSRRVRVVNFVRYWIESAFDQDFLGDRELQEAARSFALRVEQIEGNAVSFPLLSALDHKLSSRTRKKTLTFSSLAPSSFPMDYSMISSLFDINPLEVSPLTLFFLSSPISPFDSSLRKGGRRKKR